MSSKLIVVVLSVTIKQLISEKLQSSSFQFCFNYYFFDKLQGFQKNQNLEKSGILNKNLKKNLKFLTT